MKLLLGTFPLVLFAFLLSHGAFGQSSSGNALFFSSNSTQVVTTSGNTLSSLNFPFTVTWWMRVGSNNNINPIFSSSVSSTGYSGVSVDYDGANELIRITLGSNNGFTPAGRRQITAPASNVKSKWVHVAVTVTTPTNAEVYINGAPRVTSYSGTGGAMHRPSNANSYLGYSFQTSDRYFDGYLDQISVWSRVLSLTEIRQYICQKITGTEPGLLAHYNFDGSGNIITDLSNQSVDMGFAAGTSTITRTISQAPLGDTSVFLYALGSVTLRTPSGLALTGNNNTGGTDGVHIYYVSSHPDQDAGLGGLCDTLGHFGRFFATNPAQPNVTGPIGVYPPMSSIYVRDPANAGTWNTAPVTQTLYFGQIFKEFLFDPGQFLIGEMDRYPVCDSTHVTAPDVFDATYTWSNGSTGRRIPIPPVGTHFVTISTNCATVVDTFEVYADTILDDHLPATAEYCLGDSVLVFPYANMSISADSIVWSDGVEGQRYLSSPGWYYAYAKVSGSCWRLDSVLATEINTQFSFGPDLELCAGTSTELNVPNSASNIVWSTASTQPTIQVSSPGVYWVSFTQGNCTLGDTIEFDFTHLDATVASSLTLCRGEVGQLTVTAPVAADSIWWSTGETTASVDVDAAGTYYVTYFASGCEDTDTVTVSVVDGVQSTPTQNRLLCEDESIELILAGIVPESYTDSLVWNDGKMGDTLQVDNGGFYFVDGRSPCGPFRVTFLVEEVNCELYLYIPTAFSPNGDGVNDQWITQLSGLAEYKLMVFDRWGNLRYEGYQGDEAWTGEGASSGAYGYVLEGRSYRGEPVRRTGTVVLLD